MHCPVISCRAPGAALLVAVLVTALSACAPGPELPDGKAISTALQDRIANDSGHREATKASLTGFYEAREFTPAWIENGRPGDAADDLVAALRQTDQHGLDTSRYDSDGLGDALVQLRNADRLTAARIAEVDSALTVAYLDLAVDLHHGQIDPGSTDSRWTTPGEDTDFKASLGRALESGMEKEIRSLAPAQPGYQRLREQRARYAAIIEQGGWQAIPAGDALEQGQRSPRIARLRERLQITGDLAGPADDEAANNLFDEQVVEALRQFQDRHGLEEDAVLGPATVKALNVPARQRLREIDANLERWRWLPADLGERHIVVNVPEYRVRAFEDGEKAVEMKVIVGKTYDDRETPIFTDEMQFVVFRPFWGIPHGIAVEEILPEAREDLGYLATKQYQIVADYSPDAQIFPPTQENLDRVEAGELRMRQQGGTQNALGLVKFLFPNQYAVYLHDTPADHLFEKRERSFSHGCIRLEKPAEMARFVLSREGDWDMSRIETAMNSGSREQVNLQESIPVYILYWTAFAHEDGRMQFRKDIYGQDEALMLAMEQSGE